MANKWLENATNNLLPLSKNQTSFNEAQEEWFYRGIFEDEMNSDSTCQLCEHENIRYKFQIQNKFNKNEMQVGSSCIKKFISNSEKQDSHLVDSMGIIVTKRQIEEDKTNYLKQVLLNYLTKYFNRTDFQRSITALIRDGNKLTIKQAVPLRRFYYKLDDEGRSAFKKIVKIKMSREYHKQQYGTIYNQMDKFFINAILTPIQRKRVNDK